LIFIYLQNFISFIIDNAKIACRKEMEMYNNEPVLYNFGIFCIFAA
jgi:hypothetical protein